MSLHSIEHKINCLKNDIDYLVGRVACAEEMLGEVLCLLKKNGKAVGLAIQFGSPIQRSPNVANKKASGSPVKCPCLAPKSGGMKAVMPDVTLTDPLPKSITLQPLDKNGQPVALTPADSVLGTLSSNSSNLVIAQDTDTLHYTATIPANTPTGSTADLTATLKGTIQGAPADLGASVHVIISVPPSPVATDLAIVFA